MSTRFQRITPFFWFHDNAEEAVNYYVSIFDDSRIVTSTRYDAASGKATGQKPGAIMTIAFQLAGQDFVALNGGPVFDFTPAISMVVNCHDQQEIDRYWDKLSAGGDPKAQQCGWLKDRFGMSWQIVPADIGAMLNQSDQAKAHRTSAALMQMKKLDIQALKNA